MSEDKTRPQYKVVQSRAVWKWPEFEAFRKRLGIPQLPNRELTIHLVFDGEVIVEQEYLGQDTHPHE